MASPNLDYIEEYGEGTFELQPTIIPDECNFTSAKSVNYENIQNVQLLFQRGIINWPNFTNCLPNCGFCTQFASDQFYINYNLVVIGILLPFIGLCGLCGNILSAFVYSRPSLRDSYNGSLYLSALGCSDAAVIITALFLFFVDSIRRYSLSLSIVYGSLSPIVYPAGMIAQTCSVYFTIVAGLDCFLHVVAPSKAKALFSTQRFKKFSVSSVLIFAFLYNVPHCFESVLLDCWHQHFHSRSVELCPAPLRYHPTYTLIYYKYLYAMFLAVGPLLVLIFLNTVVIIGTVICKRGNADEDNTALILIVLLFILCNTIALLINIFETHLSTVLLWRINYIIDISNVLVVFNSSFNFVIYYQFSRPFRSTFLRHFCNQSKSLPNCEQLENGKSNNGQTAGMGTVTILAQVNRSPLIGIVRGNTSTSAQKNGVLGKEQRHHHISTLVDDEVGPCWIKRKEEEGEGGRRGKCMGEEESCVWERKGDERDNMEEEEEEGEKEDEEEKEEKEEEEEEEEEESLLGGKSADQTERRHDQGQRRRGKDRKPSAGEARWRMTEVGERLTRRALAKEEEEYSVIAV